MNRPEEDSPEAQARLRTAAEWLVKRDRGLTAAEQDEFLQWLAADSRHGEWFALHRRLVGNFDCLVQWRPEHSAEPNPDLLARPRRGFRWFTPVGLAAAAAIAVAFVWWRPWVPPREGEPTRAGTYEHRILADGSTVELNRGAVVSMAFTAGERRVTLVRGEALFTVVESPERPFIVRAGEVDVRAIGTAFNVRLEATTVVVLVTKGKVALNTKDPAAPAPSVVRNSSPETVLQAGQRAIASRTNAAPPQIAAVTAEESARLLAWQPQLLDFSSAPLERAVAEFNRRNRVQFTLADPELAAMPIVASIRSDNVDGFARFLAATPGVQVERRSETEIVLRRKK